MADKNESNSVKGLTITALSKEEKAQLGINNGVKVDKIGAGPFKGKLPNGFVITKIDKQSISSPQQAKALLEKAEGALLIEGKNADGSDNVIGLKID